MNDLMRRLLWLPDQASTFAPKVDTLHYFVIAVTMIASTATGLMAFYFFFKYRERRRNQSTPLVIPSVKFEVLVIGHLRDEKDPLRAAEASRSLPESSRIRVVHLGRAHDEAWADRARAEMDRNPRYGAAKRARRRCAGRWRAHR